MIIRSLFFSLLVFLTLPVDARLRRTYYCSLEKVPAIAIFRDPSDGALFGGRRLGRSQNDPESLGHGLSGQVVRGTKLSLGDGETDRILQTPDGSDTELPKPDDGTRNAGSGNHATTTNPSDFLHFFVKPCDCVNLLKDSVMYCPAEFDSCFVSVELSSDKSWVNCHRSSWLITYSRQIWKYVAVIYATLFTLLFFSRAGRSVLKYLLSFCFPLFNKWVVEEILRNQNASRDQRRVEILSEWRRRRREEGFVSGYKLKTKIFRASCNDNDDDDNSEQQQCSLELGEGESVDRQNGKTSMNKVGLINVSGACCEENDTANESNSDGEQTFTCSICLLAVEDGDRIAALKCNHHYHADCLSEWIKKKNACPLCQDDGIAEEIREYGSEDEGAERNPGNNDLEQNHSARAGWLVSLREKARRRLLLD